jgi:hypothetical protein
MASLVIEEDDIIENAQANQIIVHKADLTAQEEKDLAEEAQQGEPDGATPLGYEIDEDEPEEKVFEFLETEYSQSEKESFSNSVKINSKTLETGIKVATLANKNLNDLVKEEPSGSFSGPVVDLMLKAAGCRPGKAPWHAAAVTYWFKESGAPIPSTGASTAAGWLKWAKDTHRFMSNPIVGAAAIYGTTEQSTVTAHHLGCVVQILDGEQSNNVLCVEVVGTELQLVQSNVSTILGFVLPSADPPPRPVLPKNPSTGKVTYGPIPGISKQEQDTGIHYFDGQLVFRQNRPSPWSDVIYGPDPSYSDIHESGCGLCSLAAAMRNLTGNTTINPKLLAQKHGKYHVKNVGSSWALMTEVPPLYGCNGEAIGKDKQKAIACLTKGGYLTSVGSGKPPYSGLGHFIMIRKYDKAKDVFYVGNSWYRGISAASNTTPYTWDQLIKCGMKNSWAITRK